jgi:hypothetical protein
MEDGSKKIIAVGVPGRTLHYNFSIESKVGLIVISKGITYPSVNYNDTIQSYAKCNISEYCILAVVMNIAAVGAIDIPYDEYMSILFIFIDSEISFSEVRHFMESFAMQR